MKLVYLPLEKYVERYTEFLSEMVEAYLEEYDIPAVTIVPHAERNWIDRGLVLDPRERSMWGFAQMNQLIAMILDGRVTKEDAIYIEDFWHPGFEMLPYTLSLVYGPEKEKWPRIYSFCHAQSVDPHDFTAPMAWWMRSIEMAWAKCQDKIFVAAKELQAMLEDAHIRNVVPVGTVFNGKVLFGQFDITPGTHQMKRVVFSSRWDPEKNPLFFCQVIDRIMRERDDIHFLICTGRRQLTTNVTLAQAALRMEKNYPQNVYIQLECSKKMYYEYLGSSKVQFNCASQDFVSYTLLEAAFLGCYPCYPHYLTFPDALNHNPKFMYARGNINDACQVLMSLIDNTDGYVNPMDLALIHQKYSRSFTRMLHEMGFNVGPVKTLEEEHFNARYTRKAGV